MRPPSQPAISEVIRLIRLESYVRRLEPNVLFRGFPIFRSVVFEVREQILVRPNFPNFRILRF